MKNRLPAVVILLTGIAACIFSKVYIIPYANVVWDEALAQSWVYIAYAGIVDRTASLISYAFYGQVVYPPLFSFFYAVPVTLFSEFTIQNARSANLVWFLVNGMFLYWFSRHIWKESGARIGLFAAIAFYTAPIILVHASVGLREMVAVFWSICSLFWYIKSVKTGQIGFTLLTTLGLIVLFGIKYQYIMFLLAPILLDSTVEFFRNSKKRIRIVMTVLIMLIPVLFSVILWILYPENKWAIISDIFLNKGNYTGGYRIDTYLKFVPNLLLYMYSVSPVVGFILIVSLMYSLRLFRFRIVRILWYAVIINICMMLLHTNNIQERYLMLTIPFVYILSGVMISDLWQRYRIVVMKQHARIIASGIAIVVGFVIVSDVIHMPRTLYTVGSLVMKSPLFNQLDYSDKWFNFDRSTWMNRMPWESSESPQDVVNFIMDNIDLSHEFTVLGRPGEISPDYINISAILRRLKKQYPKLEFDSMTATIEVLPGSRYYTRDFKLLNAWRISEIRAVEADNTWKKLKHKEFKELGMIVTIYGK